MESNNIISAPQISGVEQCYRRWKQNHLGTMDDFIDFMVTPSAERDAFVNSLKPEVKFIGSVACQTIR